MCFLDYSTENEAEPVYEVPSEKYTSEEIIHILLDPKIDQKRGCMQSPLDNVSSSTYVVDLDCLQHPDDLKKDNFGVWTHTLWRYQCTLTSTTPIHSFSILLPTIYASFQFGISIVL